MAASAQAGESFVVGEGKQPHLTVDPAGTAHVVWSRDDVGFDETHYCRVPRGATACDVQATLPTSAIAESPTDTGTPFILRSAAGTLYLVLQRYISSDVWLWESANNGMTWSAPRKIYDWSNSTDFGEPSIGPAATEITFTVANTADSVFAANISGSESAIPARADLNDPFSDLDYNLEAVPTGEGGMIAVESRLDSSYFWRMAPGGNPSLSAAWTSPPVLIGPAQEAAQVAGGPSGQFVSAPRTCVRPGQKFRARLTWKRKKRKGNLFVKVRRADFYINSMRVKIDRTAPFTQLLTVTASSKGGSTVRLRARAFIKVKRGKSPTKSLNATFKVCL